VLLMAHARCMQLHWNWVPKHTSARAAGGCRCPVADQQAGRLVGGWAHSDQHTCVLCVTLCVSALQVRNGETPDEATAVFQYTVYDKRKPLVDDQNNKMRKVRPVQAPSICPLRPTAG
jgi:hypothetical protein